MKNFYVLGFLVGVFLYVVVESVIYVWMLSYLVCDVIMFKVIYDCYIEGFF